MSVTEQDQQRAAELYVEAVDGLQVEALARIAQALAEERERERSQWNPMIGRVLATAQEWHRNGDSHGQQIFDAIEGVQ